MHSVEKNKKVYHNVKLFHLFQYKLQLDFYPHNISADRQTKTTIKYGNVVYSRLIAVLECFLFLWQSFIWFIIKKKKSQHILN